MAGEGIFQTKKNVIVALRFLVFASLILVLKHHELKSLPGWFIAVTMVVLAGTNAWLIVMPAARFKSQMLYACVFMGDLAVVALLMVAVAGVDFYAVFVPYAITIGYTAYTRKLSSAFLTVLVATLVYAALIVTAGRGTELLSTPFLTWIIVFFLTAFFVGYLAEEIKREMEVQEKLETTRKTAEEATQQLGMLRSLHELVTDSIPAGLVVFNDDFVVEYANPQFAALLGSPQSDIKGRRIGTLPQMRDADQEQLRKLLAEAVEKKASAGPGELICESPESGKRELQCSVFPVIRGDTKLKVVAVLEDITGRKAVEEERLEKMRVESQLRILSTLSGAMSSLGSFRQIISRFASATEPILSFTACATIELENDPLVMDVHLTTGVSSGFIRQLQERMQLSMTQIVPESPAIRDIATELDEQMVGAEEGPEMASFLAVPVVVDNETVALIGFASTIPDAFKPRDISFAYTLANYYSLILSRARIEEEMLRREVEDQLQRERLSIEAARRQAEIESTRNTLEAERKTLKELKRIDELKSEFVTTVSHEMRTPMTSIKSSMDLLLSGRLGEIQKEHKPFLEIAVRNINRLAQLLDDVLNVSRIESGKLKMAPGVHEVKPVVKAVLGTLETKIKEASATVEDEVPDGITAYFDKNSLTQVLTNLVANALNHNEPGVRIAVSVAGREGGFITLSVADDGIGISDDEREKVFNRFFQSGRTYGEGAKGTGLGLTISRGLVGSMGGRLWVESREQKGADFRLTLPLTRDSLAAPGEEPAEAGESELGGILLFGKIAVLMKFATDEQVNECAREQGAGKSAEKLGEILVAKGYMIPEQRDLVLSVQQANLARSSPHDPDKTLADTILGSLAIRRGLLKEKQLNECLREQALLESEGKRALLGELLVQKGYLTVEQILGLLSEQKGPQADTGPVSDPDNAEPAGRRETRGNGGSS